MIGIPSRDGSSSEHGLLIGLVIFVGLLRRGNVCRGIRLDPPVSFLLIAGVIAATAAATSAAYAAAGAATWTITAIAATSQIEGGNLSVGGYQGS